MVVRMVDLILAKRSGRAHSRQEIQFIIDGVMHDTIKDYQLAAWLMAVCWQGMTVEETTDLTDAMTRSGQLLDLTAVGPVVGDKHSTGGVGDKTTLVFAPLLAAAGIPMAKLSGRGLGHTGGTLDKLEAIPGFDVNLPVERFIAQVKEIGAAIGGQTAELAPADGKIYALRDVTGTVESVPLIVASVLSKKIAAGANLIILDVKCGRGAFMETVDQALALASCLAEVGKRLGKPVTAVVTDMEQPLGFAVGHSVEVREAIDTLKGQGPPDLVELCLSLGALALVQAGKHSDEAGARQALVELIESGRALDKFREIVRAQGGDPAVVEKPELMPQARIKREVNVPGASDVWIEHIDGRGVAEACKLIGAGRANKGDAINLGVGVVLQGKVGARLGAGSALATIHADSEEDFALARERLLKSFSFSPQPVAVPPVVLARYG